MITYTAGIEAASSMIIDAPAAKLQVFSGNIVTISKAGDKNNGFIKTATVHGLTGTRALPTPVTVSGTLPEAPKPQATKLKRNAVYYAAMAQMPKKDNDGNVVKGEDGNVIYVDPDPDKHEQKEGHEAPLSLHTSTPANEQNRIHFHGDVPKKSMLIESAQTDRTRAKMRWWQELIKWRQLKKQQRQFDKDNERTCDDPRYQYALELDSKDMRQTNLFFGRDDLPKTIADIERVNKKASSGASERWYSEFLFRTDVTESGKKDSRKQFFLFEEYITCMYSCSCSLMRCA